MRILTINVRGIPSGLKSDLRSSNVFQDYDAFVIDPQNLGEIYGYSNDNELTSEAADCISEINEYRREQAKDLLKRGGVIVCFMRPVSKYRYRTRYQGEDHWWTIDNYDWLFESLGKVEVSKGETIDRVDTGHPFSEYLNTKPSWSAYVDVNNCRDWKILASAFGSHVVSMAKRIGLGHIILLPSYYDYHNGEILERCIIKLMGDKETVPEPVWAKEISVPGQTDLISNITEANDQADALDEKMKELIKEKDNLERWKWLLYAKGKAQLKPVVCDALKLLGCCVEPQPDKDSDGAVTSDFGTALLEIVGSKETIRIEKLGELTKNMGNFISQKQTKVKGILVGNPFCEEPLDNRPPKNSQKLLFPKELIESAEQQNITVLLSTDLYQIVCQILSSNSNEAEKRSMQERVFKGKGLVRLSN